MRKTPAIGNNKGKSKAPLVTESWIKLLNGVEGTNVMKTLYFSAGSSLSLQYSNMRHCARLAPLA